ncbi:uncharacterized protein LOC131306823 [Rhododendron vialii]|uniref:uncharacterized protein LOC131306823 n=1 Tax=Rhododendron vialii TaxID=182163 RepID=UPI00265E612E|nr:uncharacterized protein LOC131306823 [Rhododendron vialii]
MTFAEFETLFLDKYFPTPLRLAKEQEFLNLKQVTMTVTQYAAKFEELSHCALNSIPNEDKKARRFEWGLTTARKAVVVQAFTTYAEVNNQPWRTGIPKNGKPKRGGRDIATVQCFNCQAMGHYKCDYPQLQREMNENFGNQKAQQPGSAGFVRQNLGEPSQQQNDTCVQALFDFRASHSFIPTACVTALALEIEPLSTRRKVTPPLGKNITISLVCRGCELEVVDLRLTCDLRVIDMADFNVILGMDWLSAH